MSDWIRGLKSGPVIQVVQLISFTMLIYIIAFNPYSIDMIFNKNSQAHDMWAGIARKYLTKKEFDLETFRRPGQLNSKLASWEPKENSLRWYRSFLNLAFASSSEFVKTTLFRINQKSGLGQVIVNETKYKGEKFKFNLDYLIAAEEFEYLKSYIPRGVNYNFLEIGAGFGRTAHVILEELSQLKFYFIYDLPEMLSVSSLYLKNVLSPSLFQKLRFVSDIEEIRYQDFSVGIQIDGFQEMPTSVINEIYLKLLVNCNTIYLKNPVGKYLPQSAGLDVSLKSAPMNVGRSLKILDIWNTTETESLQLEHAEIYKPHSHRIVDFAPERLFPHYLNVIYQKP